MVRRSITDPVPGNAPPAAVRRLRYARRMAARDEDIAWFMELLAPLGPIAARRMFGGAGLYADGRILGLAIEGTLYLKTDGLTRDAFAAAGGAPFIYAGKAKPITVSYWTPPEEAMDSPESMRPWALRALEAAQRAALAKPAKKRAKTSRAKPRTGPR